MQTKSIIVVAQVPAGLVEALDAQAKLKSTTRSDLVRELLSQAVNWQQPKAAARPKILVTYRAKRKPGELDSEAIAAAALAKAHKPY